MKWRIDTSIVLLGVALAVHPLAAETQLTNEFLRLSIRAADHGFEVRSRKDSRLSIPLLRLAREVESVAAAPVLDPVWGRGSEARVVHAGGWQTSLRLFAGSPFLQVHTTVWNDGPAVQAVASQEMFDIRVDLGRPMEDLRCYGSGGLHAVADAPGSFTFAALVDPRTRAGLVAGWLTHERGSGVFFPRVEDGAARLQARLDFGRFEVAAKEARLTDTMVLGFFEDSRLGLEAYADAVARHYTIRLPPVPGVYCTWYHAGASNEEKLLANARFTGERLAPFGLSVMQIDDRWQRRLPSGVTYDGSEKDLQDGGPVKVFVDANANYPSGMAAVAGRVAALGLVPGVWFMPFAGNWKNPVFAERQHFFAKTRTGKPFTTRWSGTILDMTHPQAREFVRERVRRITDWGYRYFKLDGMHTGAACHNVYVNDAYSVSGRWQNKKNFGDSVLHDSSMTHIEAYRLGLQTVRAVAGPDVFILGCNVSQNMRSMGAAFGLIDSMRIGPDNGGAGRGRWNHVLVGARHGTNLYFLNNRVWHNDPDPVYVRPSNPMNAARLMVSWVAVSGSMVTTSYQFADLPPERLDLLKRCMPSHRATARPVDLFDEKIARIWLVKGEQGGVRRDVVGLFNWKKDEAVEIACGLERLGLQAGGSYAAFDYWEDRFLEPIGDRLKLSVPAGSCRVLALRERVSHPTLLSTSRHITQGIVDVIEERWDEQSKTLSGRSRVVGGDRYELRIALPREGAWRLQGGMADGNADGVSVLEESRGVRVQFTPKQSGAVPWAVKFSVEA